jgi:hypothetical protein
VNGGIVGSVLGVIGLLCCEIVGGLIFTLEVPSRAGVVSLFGAGLRVACSHSVGVCCIWWLRGIVLLPLGRRSDCMNPHLA